MSTALTPCLSDSLNGFFCVYNSLLDPKLGVTEPRTRPRGYTCLGSLLRFVTNGNDS